MQTASAPAGPAWHQRSLANSFALRAAGLAVTCVLVVATISIAVIYWSERHAADIQLRQKASNATERLEEPMRVMESALSELSRSALFTTALLDSAARRVHVAPFLQTYAFPIPAANGLALCDINGLRLAGTTAHSDCNGSSAEFRGVLADGWTRRTLTRHSDGRLLWTIYQGVRFVYTGTTEGVAVAQLVVDDLLRPLAAGLDLQAVRLETASGDAIGDVAPSAGRASDGGESVTAKLFNGEPMLDIGALSLVVVGKPQPLWNIMIRLLGAYLLATLVLVSLILVLSRRGSKALTDPLVALRDAASEIARSGDLSLPIPRAGDDEVGQLAESLDKMVRAIRTAEATRREAEERFRLIFEKNNEAILFAFPDGRIEAANPSACAMFGCTETELIALGRDAILDLVDPRASTALAERAHTGGFRGELRFRRHDGSVFEAEITSTLFDDSRGRRRSSTIIRDITQRREAADRLRESEARYRSLFDTSPNAILAVSGSQVLMANPAALALFGADETTALERRSVLDCFAPAQRSMLASHLQRTMTLGIASPSLELEALRLDGTIRIVESALTHFSIGGERVVHFVLRDVTESRRSERALSESRALIATVFDSLDEHIAVLDSGGSIVAVNEAWRRFALDIGAPEVASGSPGMNYLAILEQAQQSGLAFSATADTRAGIVGVLSRARARFDDVYTFRSPEGDRRFAVRAIPHHGANGGAVVLHEDITEFSAMQRERAESAKRVTELSRRLVAVQEDGRRQLAGELHDRTSPNLAAIGINLELIVAALEAGVTTGVASRVEDTRALLDDTSTSIREISSELRPPVLDHAGIAGALDCYADQFSRRTGIAVLVDGTDIAQRLLPETESLLFRIVQEALTNVSKHADATSVAVSLALDQGPIELTVTDDGVGFDPTSTRDGRGLGLVNMREMAEFAGGRLSVRSSPGAGTTIHVEI